MEEHSHSCSNVDDTSHVIYPPNHHVRDPNSDSVAGGSNGARYKLMSPVKLPISSSPCITIPPCLCPTSFLESPVLLSNIKGVLGIKVRIMLEWDAKGMQGPKTPLPEI